MGGKITALYNLFAMHNIPPDSFYGVERNDMARKLILAFSNYEVEQHNKAIEEVRK
ncbi:hypothetical protein [Clostridium kluyveri]|uniref:hypothetical protein n=1 Tax=Clostridium kluyveri TaxID=1534 RepID=UPI00031AC2A5|nr:hypothetical protein [Clostridium kluyveri]